MEKMKKNVKNEKMANIIIIFIFNNNYNYVCVVFDIFSKKKKFKISIQKKTEF